MAIRVALEIGTKRSFASALDWPGWARAGRTPADALTALVAYRDRYAAVAERAGLAPEPLTSVDDLAVTDELEGGSTTDFGAPGAVAEPERSEVEPAEGDRLAALLEAAWTAFDATVEAVAGATLTTGPRGGGRSVEKIVEHVAGAERGYLSSFGSRAPSSDDPPAVRAAFLATLAARARGEPVPNPARTRSPWPPRYAVRRAAWHVLDHAWELEDRSGIRRDRPAGP